MSDAAFKITIEKAEKQYGLRTALRRTSIHFDGGEVTAVLGENGAGKSTLLGLCAGLIRPTQGTVRFCRGEHEVTEREARAALGLLSHHSLLYGEFTARENLLFFARAYNITAPAELVEQLLDNVGLNPRAWDQPVKTFSRGMSQRVSVARSLVNSPKFLLWDEPLTGLDPAGISSQLKRLMTLKEQGLGALLVTHHISTLDRIADRCIILSRGKIVFDQRDDKPFTGSALAQMYTDTVERLKNSRKAHAKPR